MRGWRHQCLVVALVAMTTSCCHAFLRVENPRRAARPASSTISPRSLSIKQLQGQRDNNERLDKGFNLLEIASGVVPQGQIVNTAKESWKFVWQRFMAELAPQDKEGNYQRPSYGFDNQLGTQRYPIEANRYQLYLGNPCPWCHRVKLVVNILNLNNVIGVTTLIDDPVKASRGGWVFANKAESKFNVQDLRELYDTLKPGYTGRCTAPLLVDLKTRTIVSNESKDIVRMLPQLIGLLKDDDKVDIEMVPGNLQSKIDETNDWIYNEINNGVYQCGFATTQAAFDKASQKVRTGLQKCNDILANQNFICGDTLTESDILLLPTLLRFDAVYAPLFMKSHLRLQCNYPHVYVYLLECWNQIEGVLESIDLNDACSSYYKQLFPLNPGGILPNKITAQSLGLEE